MAEVAQALFEGRVEPIDRTGVAVAPSHIQAQLLGLVAGSAAQPHRVVAQAEDDPVAVRAALRARADLAVDDERLLASASSARPPWRDGTRKSGGKKSVTVASGARYRRCLAADVVGHGRLGVHL
ncbi:hypothetical protein [Streptomyces sp. NPDC101249]|uniref:hypothetical protein n=1 Tax=Streptomyces sp. NPDC101249 TaxID=3366140 RepID=UPI00381C4889